MAGRSNRLWLDALVGDTATARLFSDEAELAAMLKFERALARAESELGLIPAEAGPAIAAACEGFAPDQAALAAGMARDGVVVPELVRQLRAAVGEPHAAHVHFGATSQDAVDTALALRVPELMKLFSRRLAAVTAALEALATRSAGISIRAFTRMRQAGTIEAAHKIAVWRQPVDRAAATLAEVAGRLSVLQLGGPRGDRASFAGRGDELAARLAELLDLSDPGAAWHSERGRIAELGDWTARLTGGLGKIGADISLLALTGDVAITGGGGSSSMPGKINPVSAEILVTLAQFTAAQSTALHSALVHENERSGAAWTLEWMVLPDMLVAGLAGLRHAETILADIEFRSWGGRKDG